MKGTWNLVLWAVALFARNCGEESYVHKNLKLVWIKKIKVLGKLFFVILFHNDLVELYTEDWGDGDGRSSRATTETVSKPRNSFSHRT